MMGRYFLAALIALLLFPMGHSLCQNAAVEPSVTTTDAPPRSSGSAGDQSSTRRTNGGMDIESEWASGLKTGRFSFGVLVVIVFLGGVLTNLTPCVFPMIPITLRLLGRQGKAPLVSGVVYASGILVTYTALGISAALSGSLFGSIMASKTFNIVFAVLMAFLALSMLGYGSFNAIQTIGSRLGTGKPSARNTFLMGVGAGLVASPCTGPILAALLAYTAGSQDVKRGAFLLFIYSLGFSVPYIVLGGLAGKAAAIRVSPNVQVITKALFASVMFALAFYYLKIPAYSTFVKLHGSWFEIAVAGLALGGVLTATVLALPRLRARKIALTVPALILGVGVFGVIQSLTGGQASAGAGGPITALTWHKSEAEAFQDANLRGLPLLVDGWAEWCEACKKMDAQTFSDPAVAERLRKRWVLLKLDLTESNELNDQLIAKYGFGSLPTLYLLPANGDLTKKKPIQGFVPAETLFVHLTEFETRLGAQGN